MTIKDNINLEKLEEFRTFLKDNPDKAKLSLEARAVYEGQAGRSTIHIGRFAIDGDSVNRDTRHYTFPFGAWREVEGLIGVEGPTDRMEPVEMALAATAACLINSISFNAVRLGIDTEGLEIMVKTTVDPRVLFAVKGPEDHGSCLGTIEYDVKVSGDVSDEDLKTIDDLCNYSPVYGLMAEKIQTSGTVSRA
jgi:uncharacterized OsmC-like protein